MKKIVNHRGQSLVEVMLALAVLTAGFLGILTLLAQSIHISKTLSDQTTAAYLAAEGIEVAKNLIDHDVYQHLEGIPGATGWGSCFGLTAGQQIDLEMDYSQVTCPPPFYNSSDILYFDPTTHLYSYTNSGGAAATPFSRLIRIKMDASIPEMTVESIVTWSDGLTSQEVDLEDDFYNWHP